MNRHINIVCSIFIFLLLSNAYASPGSGPRFQECVFPEPQEAICPGDHPGIATTSQRSLSDSITFISGALTDAISLALGPRGLSAGSSYSSGINSYRMTGQSAGNSFSNWSSWLSYGRTITENDNFFTESDATLDSFLVGIDASPRENMILGLAFGYENNDIDTVFNAGEQNIDGFTIAPYFGYLINQNFSVDLSIGYSSIDIDQFRLSTFDGLGLIINGDTDSDRWFVSGNLNAFKQVNNIAFSGRAGIIYAEDDIDAIVEISRSTDAFNSKSQSVEFGQFQIGAEVAYAAASLEPYASLFYEYDFEYEDLLLNSGLGRAANDDDDIRISVGARYFGEQGFSAILEWNVIADRQEYDSNTISLTGRLDF